MLIKYYSIFVQSTDTKYKRIVRIYQILKKGSCNGIFNLLTNSTNREYVCMQIINSTLRTCLEICYLTSGKTVT